MEFWAGGRVTALRVCVCECVTGAENGNELPHMHYKTTSQACINQFKGTRKRLRARWK